MFSRMDKINKAARANSGAPMTKREKALAREIVDVASRQLPQRPRPQRRRPQRQSRPARGGPNRRAGESLGVPPPTFSDKVKRPTRVESDEFITEVRVDNGTNISTYSMPINPGLESVFPILSQQAKVYEKWEVEDDGFLEFYYKPRVTEFKAGVGVIAWSIDYDSKDPEPQSMRAVLNNDPHSEGMPHQSLSIRCDKKALRNGAERAKYIRTTNVLPTGGDIKTYDGGVVRFSFTGVDLPEDTTLGELHVRYRMALSKQQIVSEQGVTGLNQRNYVYGQTCSKLEDESIHLADDEGDWITLPMGEFYFDPGIAATVVNGTEGSTIYHPGDIPQIAFGSYTEGFGEAMAINLPEGRFLLICQVTANANDHEGQGNMDYFRLRLNREGEPFPPTGVPQKPYWSKEMCLVHHMEPHEGYDFSFTGGSVDYMMCVPGNNRYSFEYQMSTDGDVGAAAYVMVQVIAL
jgi:hypothetical protein